MHSLHDCNITNTTRGTTSLARNGNGKFIAIVSEEVTVSPINGVTATHAVVSRPSGATDFTDNALTPDVRGEWVCSISVGGVAPSYTLVVCHADTLELGAIKYETHSDGRPNTDRTRRIEDRFRILQNYLNSPEASVSALTHATPATGLAGIEWKRYGA